MNARFSRHWPELLLSLAAVAIATAWAAAPSKQVRTSNHVEMDQTPEIQLCQACGPNCAPGSDNGFRPLQGIECGRPGCGEPDWRDHHLIPWQEYGQGEYVGPPRFSHVPEYRLRVDDLIDCVFRATREELSHAYQLEVGDVLQIESVN